MFVLLECYLKGSTNFFSPLDFANVTDVKSDAEIFTSVNTLILEN